jgi:BirA family biotin operon repressor/biotin-[acetyl-CoA-carboxylase] ligase
MAAGGAQEGTVIQGGMPIQGALRLSVVLRPRSGLQLGLLALIATFCASEGIRKDTGIITWIRWPDEIVAGAEVVATTSMVPGGAEDAPWAVLNFRINRGHPLTPGQTSLDDLLGVSVDQDMLVAKILDSLSWMHSGWVKEMYPQILARITSMLENVGARVVVSHDGKAVPGIARGVDEKGRLIVDIDGTEASARVEDRSGLLNI